MQFFKYIIYLFVLIWLDIWKTTKFIKNLEMKHKVGDDVRGIMLLRHYEALRAKTDM